jgi:two-component system, chemotaxis family, sensor kinase CheA
MNGNDELLPDFLAETSDLLEQARAALDSLPAGGDRAEVLNSVFRAVHTIKGGAGIFGYENTKNLAHKLENLLDKWRKAPEKFNADSAARTAKALDLIETILQSGDKSSEKGSAETYLLADSPAPTATEEAAPEPYPGAPASPESGELASLAQELMSVAAEPVPEKPKQEPKPSAPVRAAPSPATPAAASPQAEFLRVPVDRVQRNLDVISEVFLIRNQMTYLVEKHFASSTGDHGFLQAWEGLDNALRRSIGELESVAMSMRMMPMQGLFSRMEKTVRAYTTESGKEIRLEKRGEDTELDKKVLDALGEPLIHLIRNAMDHGIESPDLRRASGKPSAGTITLSAKMAGNEVVLTVEDDGKGIDAGKVRDSAIAKGFDVTSVTDNKAAVELIFLPGFSTASSVTETSGRGVGMDVVKAAVERLGGTISIETELGEGTSFVIRLPLSMSVIPAIVVRLNGALYAVGTADIIETQRVPAKAVKFNAGEAYISYRGRFVPCHDLETFLHGEEERKATFKSTLFLCLVRHKDSYLALRVGALENNTEIVVKPMPPLSPEIPYVTGISVLPTGQPVFVLSLGRLCREKLSAPEVGHEAA